MSGNTIWPQAAFFFKPRQIDHIWHFLIQNVNIARDAM